MSAVVQESSMRINQRSELRTRSRAGKLFPNSALSTQHSALACGAGAGVSLNVQSSELVHARVSYFPTQHSALACGAGAGVSLSVQSSELVHARVSYFPTHHSSLSTRLRRRRRRITQRSELRTRPRVGELFSNSSLSTQHSPAAQLQAYHSAFRTQNSFTRG